MVKLDPYSICMYPMYDKSRGEIMCGHGLFANAWGINTYWLRRALGRLSAEWILPIGSDVHTAYRDPFYVKLLNREIPPTRTAITNTIFRRHLNGRVFLNDPDVFILRNGKSSGHGIAAVEIHPEQKGIACACQQYFRRCSFVSDNTGVYSEEQKQILLNAYKGYGYKVLSADSDPRIIAAFA